jgi:IclR family acetate operon transcriptional repressor
MSKIVERTLDLLELFGREKCPLTLSDVARLLGIPVSSCHDVLQAMQARGYLYEIAPRAGYYPTLRIQTLGKIFADHDPVLARAGLLLRSLRDALDETVMLARASVTRTTYLLAFEATNPLRFMVDIGDSVRSLYATSGGKAALGALDPAALEEYLKGAKLAPLTERTITSKDALRQDLERGRQRGWFLNDGESIEGVTTISAHFRWNAAVYIVTVAAPSARLDPRLEKVGGMVTNICQMLEMQPQSA